MDAGSFLGGLVVGFLVGAIVLTATGREVTAKVTRATGERLARRIEK